MAGEKEEVLDMSMFNIQSLPGIEQNTEEINTEETIVEEVTPEVVPEQVQDINENQADGVNQEKVGDQETSEDVVEETPEVDTETPADSDDKVFTTLGTYFAEQGILTSLDKDQKITSLEDMSEAIAKEVKSREYANLTDTQKTYLTGLATGLPEETIKTHLQSADVYKSITDAVIEEREDVRKELIVQDLLTQGWTPERAEKQYSRLYDLGESVQEAKVSRESLKKKEAADYDKEVTRIETEKQNAVTAEAERLEDLKKSVFDQKAIFDNYSVNDGLKNKVHTAMTKVVGYTEAGVPLNSLMKEREANPVEFETNLYYLWELTNGFKDLKKFTTKASTRAAKEVKQAVSGSPLFQTASGSIAKDENEYSAPPIVDIL